MATPFYKSPSLFSALFIVSLPLSYFSIWAGAILQTGSLSSWIGPFVVFRLSSYALIMAVGMILFRKFTFRKSTSILKVILTAFTAPLAIFMVMAIFDSVTFQFAGGGTFTETLPARISLYLSRFYAIGVIAALIAGLMYHLSLQAESQREAESTFS